MDLKFEAGYLYPPVFTDGFFHGVHNRSRDEVHLALEDAFGNHRTLILTGVRAAVLNGFTNYNIIGDIYFRKLNVDEMRPHLEKLGVADEKYIRGLRESHAGRVVSLMAVFPCCGGEFLSLCKRVRVGTERDGPFPSERYADED